MSDNNFTKLKDPDKIHLDEVWELIFWTRKFNCTESQLRRVIRMAGNKISMVEKFFNVTHDNSGNTHPVE